MKFKKLKKRLSKQKKKINSKFNHNQESLVKIERKKGSKTRQIYKKKLKNNRMLLI